MSWQYVKYMKSHRYQLTIPYSFKKIGLKSNCKLKAAKHKKKGYKIKSFIVEFIIKYKTYDSCYLKIVACFNCI